MERKNKKSIMCLIGTIIAIGIFIIAFFRLNTQNLIQPIIYNSGDTLFFTLNAKSILTSGWIWGNTYVGAPFGCNLLDFPSIVAQNFDALFLKVILLFFKEPFIATNIELFLTPLIIGATSFITLKYLNITDLMSFCGAFTYALLPFYFLRGIGHMVLTAYYFVPFSVLLCYFCYNDDIFTDIKLKNIITEKNIIAIVFCVLIANNGIAYYPAFTCFFLIVTGVVKYIESKKMNAIKSAGISVLLICSFFGLNLMPVFYHNYIEGKNSLAASRLVIEADINGLKITQMLLPLKTFADTRLDRNIKYYHEHAPLHNENISAYLGALGTIGFLFLLFQIFGKFNENDVDARVYLFSKLNIAGVLLATIGGFGSIFAVLVTPMLRGYNRISVFIAFFSITTSCIFLDRLRKRKDSKLVTMLIVMFVVAGVIMQVPKPSNIYNREMLSLYRNDKSFIEQIEKQLPDNSMIYQFPYHQFPESSTKNNMLDYQLFIAPLHSKTLRWSYGVLKGRYGDYWNQMINKLPMPKRIIVLSMAGFSGIYIESRAYDVSELNALMHDIEEELDEKPQKSSDGKLIFYSMKKYNERVLGKFGKTKIEEMREAILNIPCMYNYKGIYGEEQNGDLNYRWMEQNAEIVIDNPGKNVSRVLSFVVNIPQQPKATFCTNINGEVYRFDVQDKQDINIPITIKHGKNIIKLSTNANRVIAPGDSRNLYVMLQKLNMTQLLNADIFINSNEVMK